MFTSKFFDMGRLVVTREINEALSGNNRFALEVALALERFSVKDWGDLCESDKEFNNDALHNPDDLCLLAAYRTCKGKIYIVTSRTSKKPGDNSTIVSFPEKK